MGQRWRVRSAAGPTVSAVLCAASVAMWCRSYLATDRLVYTSRNSNGAWVVHNHAIKYIGGHPGVAKAVENLSVASARGRILLARVGFVIARGQGVDVSGGLFGSDGTEPDHADDAPHLAAVKPGFALEHPDQAEWVTDGFPKRGAAGFRHGRASWMVSHGSWQSPKWDAHAEEFEVPYWLPVVLHAAWPAARTLAWWRGRRRELLRGLCADCGYDLRASPGRCPECGRVPRTGTPSAAADSATAH
jgi:hypothetical protein